VVVLNPPILLNDFAGIIIIDSRINLGEILFWISRPRLMPREMMSLVGFDLSGFDQTVQISTDSDSR